MSTEINALLVFCEGPHDSAFVRMVFKKLMGFKVEKLKFSEMPSPFNSLFEQAVKTHAALDMSLDMTHKFFLPDIVLRKNAQIVFVYNCGGKTQYEKIRSLLSSYIPMLEQARTFPQGAEEIVQSTKYLFLYDADAEGIGTVASNLKSEFSEIDETSFLAGSWEDSASAYGQVANDKALFVWGGDPNKGTLEDLLVPMVEFAAEDKSFIANVKKLMADTFTWETNHVEAARSVAELEKYNKAVLTVSGQRKKPGSSLNVILEQSGLITEDALKSCKTTQGFVRFVNEFLGLADESAC